MTRVMPRFASSSSKEITNVATAGRSGRNSSTTSSTSPITPAPQDIRVRAYEIYVANGAQPGREVEDWVQAERELSARVNVVTR